MLIEISVTLRPLRNSSAYLSRYDSICVVQPDVRTLGKKASTTVCPLSDDSVSGRAAPSLPITLIVKSGAICPTSGPAGAMAAAACARNAAGAVNSAATVTAVSVRFICMATRG